MIYKRESTEVEILALFYNCLYSYKLRGVGEDKLMCGGFLRAKVPSR
jgi:hypothetical protein